MESPDAKTLNVTTDIGSEEARALHRVVRAMHDGHCPQCGCLKPSDAFYVNEIYRWQGHDMVLQSEGAHVCPDCGFTITNSEAAAALATFVPFMRKNLTVYKAWAACQKVHTGIVREPTFEQVASVLQGEA